MNRRKFLLGCITSPIAAKVDAVSAALRPDVYGLSPIQTVWPDMQAMQQMIEHMRRQLIETMYMPNELLDQPPLDRPGPAWHDGKAGRDQIG